MQPNPAQSRPSPDLPLKLAAGGLVTRQFAGKLEIAIVHRRRYGEAGAGDFSLPKGHVEPGESWAEAALREVREETGCACEITGPAEPTSYMIGTVPKLVLFFPMRCLEQRELTDSAEVAALLWLPLDRAAECLSYASERDLVQRLAR